MKKTSTLLTPEQFESQVATANSEGNTQQSIELSRYFITELQKAMEHGRICVEDRMFSLYKVVHEINAEQIEIDQEWSTSERFWSFLESEGRVQHA